MLGAVIILLWLGVGLTYFVVGFPVDLVMTDFGFISCLYESILVHHGYISIISQVIQLQINN